MFFKNYEYFLAIAKEGSLSEAARKLYITQPALSNYLKRLEQKLGIELFDHSSSPLKLTYYGERYLSYLNQSIRLEQNMQKEFRDIQNEQQGKIRFGLALWRGSVLLPLVLPVFSKRFPLVEYSFVEGRSSFLQKELLNGNLDFSIMNMPESINYDYLVSEEITQERILLAGRKDHPLVEAALRASRSNAGGLYEAAGSGNSAPDIGSKAGILPHFDVRLLADETVFLTSAGQNLTVIVDNLFSQHDLDPHTISTANLTTAINLVSVGMGFTFIPEGGAGSLPDNLALFTVGDGSELSWPLVVLYRKTDRISNHARTFIDTMKELFVI